MIIFELNDTGCDGGFSYLTAGKYAEDFGMVTEDCNTYVGRSATCNTDPECPRYYTKDYEYVGGYYGAYVLFAFSFSINIVWQ